MSGASELARLQPAARAQLLYRAARDGQEIALWRAALGSHADEGERSTAPVSSQPLLDFQSLLQALTPFQSAQRSAVAVGAEPTALVLGPNQSLAPAITAAAERTGLPPAALAAIVDAESTRDASGAWITDARNPRSSALGLGQFLQRSWVGEAERDGTFLHRLAADRGWLGADGHIAPAARAALLVLRAEPTASIEATADYARANLDQLRRRGIDAGDDVGAVARTAWLAHHLGPGDARRFLAGGLGEERAAHLLAAQVGVASASRRIAAAGDAASAHRDWLLSYLDRRLRPDLFTA